MKDGLKLLAALLAGLLFGAGLTISDMVNPERVIDFLDVAGTFDPTLAFVMCGALAVALPGYRLGFRRKTPFLDRIFHLPTLTDIDARLIGGAALFGIGWGIGGICPGPGIAALVSLRPEPFIFVAAMLAGMAAAKWWTSRAA